MASRVPELESRLTDLEGLRVQLHSAEDRVAELEPIAAELDLRNQFIETLQRELTYRDERLVSLEGRVDGLQRQLLGESPIRRLPSGRNDQRIDQPAAMAVPKEPIDLREPATTAPTLAQPHPVESPDEALPPVGRAFEQALDGLGVRSFADLACVAEAGDMSSLPTATALATAPTTGVTGTIGASGVHSASVESITDTVVESVGPPAVVAKVSAVVEFSAGR